MIIKNKGMFLEELIKKWGLYIQDNNLGYISKIPTNYKIVDEIDGLNKVIFVNNKNCDFIGLINSKYIEFDAKETELDYFNLNNVKKSQFEKIDLINQLQGNSFLLIYFHKFEKIFLLNFEALKLIRNYKVKKIPFSWFEENGINIKINNLVLNLHNYL